MALYPQSIFPFRLFTTSQQATQRMGSVDANGIQMTTRGGSNLTSNVNTSATVIKAAAGRLCRVYVTTAGSAAGSANNCATTGAVAAANLITTIPNTVGIYDIDAPCSAGIVVTPGSGQVLSVSWA